MRRARGVFLAAVWGLGVLACAAQASPRPALVDPGYDPASFGLVGSSGHGVIGWQFSPQADIWLTQLGFFDMGLDGLTTAHDVGIWDQSHNLVAVATVPPGTTPSLTGHYRYGAVTPVLLRQGDTYTIGATVPDPQFSPPPFLDPYPNRSLEIDPALVMLDPFIGLLAANRYARVGAGGTYQLVFPSEIQPSESLPIYDLETGEQVGTIDVDPYYFAANLIFVIPEPGSLCLVLAGALGARLGWGSGRRVQNKHSGRGLPGT